MKSYTVAWVAIIISIVAILISIFSPYINHWLYDTEITTFDVDLPSENMTPYQIPDEGAYVGPQSSLVNEALSKKPNIPFDEAFKISGNRVRIPFAITNYGTVPSRVFDKFVNRDNKEMPIKLYDVEDRELPFKTVYMEGEGMYGFIYLEKPSARSEIVSFCVKVHPTGRFSRYALDAKVICTPSYMFIWGT